MATPFEMVILKMQEMGLFQFFFPFMLSSAIFYGLIRKSKIFGDPEKNVAVNAVVALVASFMVWAYPIIAGVNIEEQLAAFFTQGTLALLATMFGLLAISMFTPDLGKKLDEIFKGRLGGGLVFIFLLVGFGILVSSGLFVVFFPAGLAVPGIPQDWILTIGIILLMIITVLVIIFLGGK